MMLIYECNETWELIVPSVAGFSFFIAFLCAAIINHHRENDDKKITFSGIFGGFYYLFSSSDLNIKGKKWLIPFRISALVGIFILLINPC